MVALRGAGHLRSSTVTAPFMITALAACIAMSLYKQPAERLAAGRMERDSAMTGGGARTRELFCCCVVHGKIVLPAGLHSIFFGKNCN